MSLVGCDLLYLQSYLYPTLLKYISSAASTFANDAWSDLHERFVGRIESKISSFIEGHPICFNGLMSVYILVAIKCVSS